MSEHTPGPWEIVGTIYPSIKQISGPSFRVSAVLRATDLDEKDYQKRMADMCLIAAAPELLESLEWYAEKVADFNRYGWTREFAHVELLSDSGRKARAAIAKAKGESNE